MNAGNGISDFIKQNGLTLVLGAALLFSNYNSDSTRTAEQLRQINARLDQMAATQRENTETVRANSRRFSCVVRTTDRLADRAGIDTPCPMEGE